MWIVWIIAIIVVLLIAENLRELHMFVVTRYRLSSPKLAGLRENMKIIVLSDLHDRSYGMGNEKLLAAIRLENPDAIMVVGDMLVARKPSSYIKVQAFMTELVKICPTYYSNGNHEQRLKEYPEVYGSYEEYVKELLAAGIQLLGNDSVYMREHSVRIRISGLELSNEAYRRYGRRAVSAKEVRNLLGEANLDSYQILLAHDPAHYPAYKRWGADLVLSGHTHGGIIRIPNWRGVITPQGRLFPKYSGGLYKEGSQAFVVSRGLGTHTVNVRLLNQPELIVLTLSGKDNEPPLQKELPTHRRNIFRDSVGEKSSKPEADAKILKHDKGVKAARQKDQSDDLKPARQKDQSDDLKPANQAKSIRSVTTPQKNERKKKK